MDVAPGTVIGSYRVERTLGRGGQATVYLAEHAILRAPYALKVLHDPRPEHRRRLILEGRSQSSLRHPNVLAVVDVQEWAGCPVLVLEYVHGPSLEELLRLRGPLPLPHVDALAVGLIRGVRAAHARGLLHRDLKPSNVLLAEQDGELVPKVTDFGLAKVERDDDAPVSASSAVFGTPGYMPPEQLRGSRDVDVRSDLFATGCVLYELLAGRQAFPGRDAIAVHERMTAGQWAPLATVRPDVPARMVDAISACLQADPGRRPASCDQLLEGWRGGADGASVAPPALTPGEWAELEVLRRRRIELAATPGSDHLAPHRLESPDLTDPEQAHLAQCTRCRVDRLRARDRTASEPPDSGAVTGPALPGAPLPPVAPPRPATTSPAAPSWFARSVAAAAVVTALVLLVRRADEPPPRIAPAPPTPVAAVAPTPEPRALPSPPSEATPAPRRAAPRDRDGDQVPDRVDACPDVPEDHDAVRDEDGCPDPDDDEDGVHEPDDRCPHEAEDRNGFEDGDGCPDHAGRIRLVGAEDLRRVWLRADGGPPIPLHLPDTLVRPGTYALRADVPKHGEIAGPDLTIGADAVVTVRCSASLAQCLPE